MNTYSRAPPTRSFSLRLWKVDVGAGQAVWRGRVQNLASGEVRYFQGWQALIEVLLLLLENEELNR